jgi:hypothetical protein
MYHRYPLRDTITNKIPNNNNMADAKMTTMWHNHLVSRYAAATNIRYPNSHDNISNAQAALVRPRRIRRRRLRPRVFLRRRRRRSRAMRHTVRRSHRERLRQGHQRRGGHRGERFPPSSYFIFEFRLNTLVSPSSSSRGLGSRKSC